jgi:hypothetical protein
MYDGLPNLSPPDLLDEVRCFLCDHGHDLSDAARLIAGAPGEARVIALALNLENAGTLDGGIRRELEALHALLALEHVQEGDPVEAFLLSGPGPGSRKVETICLLTDRLDDLLSRIDAVMAATADHEQDHQTGPTAKAA